MKEIMKYLYPHRKTLLIAVLLLFGQAACELALPDYMSQIINLGILAGDTGYIKRTGLAMLLVSLGSVLAAVLVGLVAARVAASVAQVLRKDIFEKVSYFSKAEIDYFTTASLITRTTNDITQIQNLLVVMIRMVIYAPILGGGGIFKALTKDVSMSWIIALSVGLLILLIIVIMIIALPKFKSIQKLIDQLNLIVRENLSGMLVIRAFNTQHFEETRFDKANHTLTRVQLFANRVMGFMMPAMLLLLNLTSVLIVWVGARQVQENGLAVGDMMAFMQYAMQIIMSFLMISMLFILMPRAAVSAQRLSEVLLAKNSITELGSDQIPKVASGTITFRNVSFAYPGSNELVLENINFTARAGKMTAFIGATGSGKSTLVNLIPRFYDVTKGEILIDQVNVKAFSLHDLREMIGYVPQKAVLFSGTIESNLRFGRSSANHRQLMKAVEVAQALPFVSAKPKGIASEIAQGGSNVSGGQKQRLSIARALAKKAPIYIFDDSFSALDLKTDAALRSALAEHIKKSAVLIVAQRISSIMDADQIIVLDEGKIVGSGTHHELMRSCKVYQEIALSQLSKEELGS